MEAVALIQDTQPIADIVSAAVAQIKDGGIDPIVAHCNISRMERAIKAIKDDKDVRDITLRELSKYGKRQAFGDVVLEEVESGIVYDYSGCGDSRLNDMYATRKALDADIKARERMLQALPASGMADPETGEIIYPPVRTSKTTIKTTFKK